MSAPQQNKLTVYVKRVLDVTWFLFLSIAVILPITVMVIGLNMPSDSDERHADVNIFLGFSINSDISTELLKTPVNESELILKGRGELKLNNTRSQLSWYLSSAITEVLLLLFLYGLMSLRKLFASLVEGSSFTQENAEHIEKIGYVFIGWNIASPVLQYFGSRIMLQDIAFNVSGIQLFPSFEINIGGFFAGFAIIVLSRLIREAASIRHDQSLTI